MEKILLRPLSLTHPLRRRLTDIDDGRLDTAWKRCNGYHFGVVGCAVISTTVFFINLIVTIWFSRDFGVRGGLGTIQEGNCHRTRYVSMLRRPNHAAPISVIMTPGSLGNLQFLKTLQGKIC